MKDTSDAMEGQHRDMILKRSGEERLKMGCSMHATAQTLVRASPLEADPSASSSSLKSFSLSVSTDRISMLQRAKEFCARRKRPDLICQAVVVPARRSHLQIK
jgi:hypothetical protein